MDDRPSPPPAFPPPIRYRGDGMAYNNDVFISYSGRDDEKPWVSQLARNVLDRLASTLGRIPRIWFDRGDNSTKASATRRDALLSSALMMPIVSRGYVESRGGTGEVLEFVRYAGSNRVVQVVRDPALLISLPNPIAYNFYRAIGDSRQELTIDDYAATLHELVRQLTLLLNTLKAPIPEHPISESGMEVFLCHSSDDKPAVRVIWEKLTKEGFLPWLDEKTLLPGQRWQLEIEKAIDRAGAVIVFLSNGAVGKEGFIQREIRSVLDKAAEKPDDTI